MKSGGETMLKKRELLLLFFLFTSPVVTAMTIVNGGWKAPPTVVKYPPGQKPSYLENMDASCQATYKVTNSPPFDVVCKDGKIVVSNLSVAISGESVITIPDPDNNNYAEHERGHYYLNRLEYNRYAEEKLREIFKDFEGEHDLNGRTCEQAEFDLRQDAESLIDDWETAMKAQWTELDDKYDAPEYTNHGNGPMSTDDAYKKIKDDRLKAERESKFGPFSEILAHPDPQVKPSALKPHISGPGAYKVDQEGMILWDPGPGFAEIILVDPNDAVKDAMAKTDEFKIIGPTLDDVDKYHIADSGFTIYNPLDPNVVYLDSSIYDIYIEPSTDPAYAWMMQGVLDIWEVDNIIGSDFIEGISAAYDANEYTSFWFYFDDLPMEPDGNWIVDQLVEGEYFIAVAEQMDLRIIDDFEDYDPITLEAQWLRIDPAAGFVELYDLEPAHTENFSMLLSVDWTMLPPAPVMEFLLMHPLPEIQDWSELSTLEIWIDVEGSFVADVPVDIETQLFVELSDVHTNNSRFDLSETAFAEGHLTVFDGTGYRAAAIDLNEFSTIDLTQVTEIRIGLKNTDIGPMTSNLLIDDIVLRGQRTILEDDPADINGDNYIDLEDFVVIAESWLKQNVWP
jgi:hypothetical protein